MLGATFIDVGLIEGVAESTASILKIVSGYVRQVWKTQAAGLLGLRDCRDCEAPLGLRDREATSLGDTIF